MRAEGGFSEDPRALSRRAFLAAGGGLGLSVALAGLPEALARHGWLDVAAAADSDLTSDTISGLAAFIIPGDDEYSVAQGVSTAEPGAVGAGAVPKTIEALDRYVPAPLVAGSSNLTIPASGGVASLLNAIALQVNPSASAGGFASPFARLSFAEKGEVFRRFESDPTLADTEFRFVAGILPGFIGFLGFSEAGVYENGKLSAVPVGWRLSNYGGPREGWKELKGYYRGRRRARGAHRFVKHKHRRRRSRRRRRARARRRRHA
jgi:hypothetical protein